MNYVKNSHRITATKSIFLVAVMSFMLILYFYQSSRLGIHPADLAEMLHQTRAEDASSADVKHRTYVNMVLFLQAGIGLTLILFPFAISIYRNRAVLNRLNHRVSYGQMLRSQLLANKKQLSASTEKFENSLLLHFPHLTANDLKMCSLLRENFSSKEIAEKLNITTGSVNTSRYRLRKKLSLSSDTDLVVYLHKIA
jgi:DNA-binding CsgD family transcriptional regulator